MPQKKFTVLKPVLHGGKLQSKDATLELDADSASTKRLVATKHITDQKPAPTKEPAKN